MADVPPEVNVVRIAAGAEYPRLGQGGVDGDAARPPKVERTGAQRERDSAQHQERFVQLPIIPSLERTTPSARAKVASRHFLIAQPPLLQKEGNRGTRRLGAGNMRLMTCV